MAEPNRAQPWGLRELDMVAIFLTRKVLY